jgi:hypothetical protein
MLRWLLLLLLLCNALLFLWYAQRQQVQPDRGAEPQEDIMRLRLLHELTAGERAQPLQTDCYRLGVFASLAEAQQASRQLESTVLSVRLTDAPDQIVGYHLAVQQPSESQAQRELLDLLALAGWVPETRAGQFLLGPFTGEQARLEALLEQDALNTALGLVSSLTPIVQPVKGALIEIEMPYGTEMSEASRRLLMRRWPGIKIEKKVCSGLAQPHSDQ